MEILAHRGLWTSCGQKNSFFAIQKAFQEGFGIETDIRDYKGKLVISHDIGSTSSTCLEDVLDLYKHSAYKGMLALNVKADGIQEEALKLLEKYCIERYFFFDMSVPEMVVYWKKELHFFSRHSDIESPPTMYEYADGVWMDSFFSEKWFTVETLNNHLKNGKKVGLISPEIHGYSEDKMWEELKANGMQFKDNIFLCTDKPMTAKEFFGL
jgi:hypothetical protein